MDFIKNVMVDKKLVTKKLETYLPSDLNSNSRFGKNGVLSFHYYDTNGSCLICKNPWKSLHL